MRRIVEETANTFEIVPQLPGMAALATLAGAAGKGWIGVNSSNKGENMVQPDGCHSGPKILREGRYQCHR